MNVKDLDNALMDPNFTVELFRLLARYGLVNEIALRNSIIRKEYQESKTRGERLQEFMSRAADKYCLSEKSVDAIIYSTHKSKRLNHSLGQEIMG